LAAAGLDSLKGLVAFEVGVAAHLPVPGVLLCGVAALLGHQFPIFTHGRGGKGLATALGVMLGLTPLSTVIGLVILGLAYLAFHDFNPAVTLATIAMILLPVFFAQPLWVSAYALVLGLMLAFKKLLDRPHEQQVWASHPWQGSARPGGQGAASGRGTARDSSPRQQ
jgi:glycerol-3-phosphate acyltransferase PlsY